MQSNRDVKKRGHLNKRNSVGIIGVAFLSFFLSFFKSRCCLACRPSIQDTF